MRAKFAIPTLIAALCPMGARAQSLLEYRNERYGFSLRYPASFEMQRPSENGDGREFIRQDSCSFIAFGSNNALEYDLNDELKDVLSEFTQVTYRKRSRNWFVISGFQGERVLFIKCFLGKGSINEIWIRYPKSESHSMAVVVNQLVKSFHPGELNESH